MRRTLERVRRQLADSVVVQQQRAQRVIPVKCSLTHFRDVIKSKISEKEVYEFNANTDRKKQRFICKK